MIYRLLTFELLAVALVCDRCAYSPDSFFGVSPVELGISQYISDIPDYLSSLS